MKRNKTSEEDYPFMSKWLMNKDYDEYGTETYVLMKTPDKKGIVDAEFYSEACHEEPKTDLEREIMSFIGYEFKVRARVSPIQKRIWNMPSHYKHFLGKKLLSFQLQEDDISWKKIIKLCEEKDTGIP